MTDAPGHVDVFGDVACPFTHLSLVRFVAAREQHGAVVVLRVHAWPLEWVNGEPIVPEHAASEVAALREQVAPDLYARFDGQRFPASSIPAFGLASAAYARNDHSGEAMSLAIRHALFEEGRDVADPAVLDEIAARYGIERPDHEATVAAARADWEAGQRQGVQGSPHFFLPGRSMFCPMLSIAREGEQWHIQVAEERVREFNAAAFGTPE